MRLIKEIKKKEKSYKKRKIMIIERKNTNTIIEALKLYSKDKNCFDVFNKHIVEKLKEIRIEE